LAALSAEHGRGGEARDRAAAEERNKLESELLDVREQLYSQRKAHWEATAQLRAKYDAALSDAEAAAMLARDTARSDAERLRRELQEKSLASGAAAGDVAVAPRAASPWQSTDAPPQPHGNTSAC